MMKFLQTSFCKFNGLAGFQPFPLISNSLCKYPAHGHPKCGSNSRSRRCNVRAQVPSHASVFTASRSASNASVVRIMGPGSDTVGGFGKLLAMDEFFVQPVNHGGEFAGPFQPETLVYYLEEDLVASSDKGDSIFNPRHGIQVFFGSCTNLPLAGTTKDGSTGNRMIVSHVREALLTQSTFLETGNGKGGAKVRVVSGDFAGLASPMPFHDFVLLDVFMRPGSEAKLTLDPSHGLLVYILEGVGIFKQNRLNSNACLFYENEGHGIWFPPVLCDNSSTNILNISTHLWSSLRFMLLGSSL